jgi:transposase InsO family protein
VRRHGLRVLERPAGLEIGGDARGKHPTPEFVAKAAQDWTGAVGAKTTCVERGSPWENGFIESFNARLRDELLDEEIFYSGEIFYSHCRGPDSHRELESLHNTERPHGLLGYKPAGAQGLHPRPRRARLRNTASHAKDEVRIFQPAPVQG